MMLTEQVFAKAALLTGQLEQHSTELLKVFCRTAVTALEAELRDGVDISDCREEFLTAASLYALAALQEAAQAGSIAEFRAGDLTVKRGGGENAAVSMRRQAQRMMQPWRKDRFDFRGV